MWLNQGGFSMIYGFFAVSRGIDNMYLPTNKHCDDIMLDALSVKVIAIPQIVSVDISSSLCLFIYPCMPPKEGLCSKRSIRAE